MTEIEAREWAEREEKVVRATARGVFLDPHLRPASYRQAGVYALFRGAEIRYIGRSSHIYRRINDHDRKAKDWDGFKIWPCRDSIEAAELERKLIAKYQPPLNTAGIDIED